MGEIDRAAIRARIEHCKAYRFGMLGVIGRQDAPDLLAALEDAERERDALAAVIEQVRSCRHDIKPSGGMMGEIWYDVQSVDRALATAPTVALEAVKAEAWNEGAVAEANRWLRTPDNPYRKTDTKEAR